MTAIEDQGLARRVGEEGPYSVRELVLTVLAVLGGGVSPLVVVTATAKLAPMPVLFWSVSVPGVLVLLAILVYAKYAGMERLYRRLWLGLLAGIFLTLALDAVRVAGVHLGYLPDSVSMFGGLITGAGPTATPTPGAYVLGMAYHLFNGIAFGVVYSVVFGRTRWWGAVVFSVFVVEVGMMLLPPMAAKFGPFGVSAFGTVWSGYFISTLLAHVAMGVVLGAAMQTWSRHRGLLLETFGRSGRTDPGVA